MARAHHQRGGRRIGVWASNYDDVYILSRPISTGSMATEKKEKLEPQIKSVDMTEEMQQEAVEVATEAMEKYHIEKDIAQYIKREFDSRKGATWHCVVGRNFGSFVTHETKHFIYFYLGHCAILLFKTQ
ncbi:dynein light chain type 1, putative [Aspergillus fumigatus A1163]|nr:dynein light chain type 1, putative [Aspergillus fumigatus A1163]